MRRKNITTLIITMLVAGAFLYAASGKMFVRYAITPKPTTAELKDSKTNAQQPKKTEERRMVDMTADDSYLIEKRDSTIVILVGNFHSELSDDLQAGSNHINLFGFCAFAAFLCIGKSIFKRLFDVCTAFFRALNIVIHLIDHFLRKICCMFSS